MDWSLYVVFSLSLLAMMFFTGMEMAFLSSSRFSLELNKHKGTAKGKFLSKFASHPALFLGTTITCYVIALTIFVLQTSEVLKPTMRFLQIESRSIQVSLEIVFNLIIIILFVEILPRALFRAHSYKLLNFFARIMNFFINICSSLVKGLFDLSFWILKYVFAARVDDTKDPFNRNDLSVLFKNSSKTSHEDNTSYKLLENAQELPKLKIRQCLIPRKEIIAVDIHTPIEQLVAKITETKLSKIIIYEETIDNIVGYIHELDLFRKPTSIESILIKIIAVPESMNAVTLLEKFSKEAKTMAWVVDEFGGTAGVITIEDVLEELFGEILDEYDTEHFIAKQLSESEYLFSGRLELDYIAHKFNVIFEEDDDSTETLSGYIINHYETIPKQKDRIIIGQYEFDIVTVSDTRIETVKLKKLN
ncbi:MAG: HlyC/CorC family transporter [Chitinophagaceae bacterium]|nr:MAG: HlyC/CorC family transporter [Chitinophagaceae bacterium]